MPHMPCTSFYREDDLAAAGVTADEAQLRAEHVDQYDRKVPQRRAFAAGADDHLLVQGLLKRRHRCVGPDRAEKYASVRAPKHDQFQRIVRQCLVGEEWLQDRSGLHRANRGADLGRLQRHIRRSLVAARTGMFCTTIVGLPGMCLPMWRPSRRA
jgi:hypothetical protein